MTQSSDSPTSESKPQDRLSKRAAGVVALAVACSRVLGLVREMVIAALFGAGSSVDVFLTAFRAPNLLRDLFAEGALSTAFITTFSKKIKTEGDDSAWRLACKMATLTCVFMSGVTLLGIVFAPQIIGRLAGGFGPEKAALAVELTRIMFPFILLVSLAALTMGMLNAKNVFGMPAMASSFFNLGSIVGGVSLAWWLDPAFGPRSLAGLAVGTLIGGLLQLVVQFPSLRRVGFRFRPDFAWRDEGVAQILRLMGPAVIAASAVQVNVLVNGNFASYLDVGAIAALGYAFRLMQLPLGIFGVAVGTVTLPVVSRFAATRDLAGVRSTLGHGLRFAFLLTVPCAAGLILFAEPIISLIYQRGCFGYADTLSVAGALRFYAVGLVAYSGIKVLAPAFYAIDKRNWPMIVSFFSIAVNYGLNLYVTFHCGLGIRGLALSTSLVAIINFVLLYVMMSRHIGGLETRALWLGLGKLALACAPLALVCLAAREWLLADLAHMAFMPKLFAVLGSIAVAALAFVAAVLLLKIEEVEDAVAMIRRKLGRQAA